MTVLVSTHYMDEAERCHKINYISYGRLLASGTVKQVVDNANLTTYILKGDDIHKAAALLKGMPGVDQVAAFGMNLHVVGRDALALGKSVDAACVGLTLDKESGETNLEDVFIQFMADSQDNMQ
jgi:ABC-2 type transport system ATP-binding protein